MERAGDARLSRPAAFALGALLALASAAYLAGVRRELPYYYEGDERTLVQIAVRMAVSQDPNPRWFGNPGSTVLYPLAIGYRLADVLFGGAPLVGPDRPLLERFRADPGAFYLAGRVLNVAYAIGSFCFLFLLGRRAFGERAALGGVLLAMLMPLTMAHSQLVRTDAAGLFFGIGALLACLRLLEAPTARRHVVAGTAIGLAIASRYFYVALLLPLAAAVLAARPPGPGRRLLPALAGFAAVAVAFIAVTPFFVLDLATALSSIRGEARATHPGADGLSPLGNFLVYATEVIPGQLGLPLALCSAGGLAAAVFGRSSGRRLLALYVLALVGGICLSPLHWPRWTIPALPVLALFAAAAFEAALEAGLARIGRAAWLAPTYVILLAALAAPTGAWLARDIARTARPTTRLLARAWLVEHLPADAKLAVERDSAPLVARQQAVDEQLSHDPGGVRLVALLGDNSFDALAVAALAGRGPLDQYRAEGFDHAVTALYAGVTLSAREREMHDALAATALELARFDPQPTRAGPLVQVWKLR